MEQISTPLRREKPFKEILDEVDRSLEAERQTGPRASAAEASVGAAKPTNRPLVSPPEDAINPAHYRKHPSGIECIEVTRHMNFNIGNAMKYIWRHMDKGDPIENLRKAQWYLADEITRLESLK